MQKKSKTFYSLLVVMSLVLFVTGSCKKKKNEEEVIKPKVGATYQGGKIFYLDNSGEHGLVAAPSDLGTGSPWGCIGTILNGADGTTLGTGNQNTIDITSSCNEAGTAAKLCSDLVLNGFSDWYLPSKDELNLLFQQKDVVGGFITDLYWSSSEVTVNAAWLQSFDNGTQFATTPKDYGTSVRAIRSF